MTRNSHRLEQTCWGGIHNLRGLEHANEENRNHSGSTRSRNTPAIRQTSS